VGVSGGQPTKGAVNIGDIVGGSSGQPQPTKGAVKIVDISGYDHLLATTYPTYLGS